MAHFVLGEDLGDPGVIDRHVKVAGIDLVALHAALEDGSADMAVEQAESLGRRHGVQGMPAWLLGEQLITGLRPVVEFEEIAQRVMQSAGRIEAK